MKRLRGTQAGFTLIELMIVILIIAILVAIAVPVMLAASNNGKRRTCQSNLRTIDSAITCYDGYYDAWPGNGACVTVLGTTWLKRDPSCPASPLPGTYSLSGGSGTSPPTVSCPGSIAGHAL
jgi:prepilin-type N-terminal cleavage/methylation domain-containing protein